MDLSELPFDASALPLVAERLKRELDWRQEKLDLEGSLSDFLKSGWRYIDPAQFFDNWHLDAIAEHLEAVTNGEIRRLCINVPPRTSKSSLVSVAWPAWTWAQAEKGPLAGPEVQFLFASYAQSLSLRDSLKTRRLIESPWYQQRWGQTFNLVGDQNTKQRFENDRGGYRLATSVGGALTGEGGSIIAIDDAHNAIEIESEAVRDATIQWWDEAISTRLNDPSTGAYVIIMQRLFENDLTGHILSREADSWTHLCFPMRYEPRRKCHTSIGFEDPREKEGELLWPERFPEVEVASLERRLGPYAAAGQLQQLPVPRGGGIFKRDWWKVWPPENEYKAWTRVIKGKERVVYPDVEFVCASLDTAMTTKEENDWSAMTVWGVFRNSKPIRAERWTSEDMKPSDLFDSPKAILMEAWQERLEFHDLVQKTIALCRKRKVDRLLIEAKANGISVGQEIIRLCSGEEFGVTLLPVRGDKVARAMSVQHLFSNGLIYAPDLEKMRLRWVETVLDEMSSFPKGAHDDIVDSSVHALRYMRDQGLLQLTREFDYTESMRNAPQGRQEPIYDV